MRRRRQVSSWGVYVWWAEKPNRAERLVVDNGATTTRHRAHATRFASPEAAEKAARESVDGAPGVVRWEVREF